MAKVAKKLHEVKKCNSEERREEYEERLCGNAQDSPSHEEGIGSGERGNFSIPKLEEERRCRSVGRNRTRIVVSFSVLSLFWWRSVSI